ncbi:CHAT domain-containing protein [Ephemerocybe angulata]|uniref:CHAT domain-containing protein n=1 Tax=Ephemerocybe angulata TaxID=980116 RepID=A0A8H6H9P2_9AGAR|nr:CHAT domain-containing protein [Tulosesus angulatus]
MLIWLTHLVLSACLNQEGLEIAQRSERTRSLSDISESISLFHRAIQLTPEGHEDLPRRLNNIGGSYMRRFEHTGQISDINEAISVLKRADRIAPEGHASLPGILCNLGGSSTLRFDRVGDISDINEAITALQRAVRITPKSNADLPGMLGNLGLSFRLRFGRSADLSDIAEAISALQRGVQLAPEGHPDLPGVLCNLGGTFKLRYLRTNNPSDINEAVSSLRRAVQLTPHGHADLPKQLNSFGGSLLARFDRIGDLSDITEAISALRRAVKLTPQGHAELPKQLTSLGNMLLSHYKRTGNFSDVSESITTHERAVKLTPERHAYMPGRLNNVGIAYLQRAERGGGISDLSEAILALQRVVKLTPQGHPDLISRLTNLGRAFLNRFARSGKYGDLDEAVSHYKAAATSNFGGPQLRLGAAREWALLLGQYRPKSPEILLAFDAALDLVALVAGLEQTVQGRYTQLQGVSGLALEAASVACSLNRVDKALEWLEQGRCLVWSQLNNLRTPLDSLYLKDAKLARSIAETSKQLESAGSSQEQFEVGMTISEKISLEDEARTHLSLARQWDDLLRSARAIPGFENFLMPLPCSTLLQHLPETGPTVIIAVSERRCDAIALLAGLDGPLHIPLPNFTLTRANEYRASLAKQLQSRNLRVRGGGSPTLPDGEFTGRGIRPAPVETGGEDPIHHVLRGLWNDLVKPILDVLGIPETLPTRVWWCPTGALSFLPIHAAGIYRGPKHESVLDYVVSSYTPNVTALTDRAKDAKARPIDHSISGLFLTNQPNAPGAKSIPGTTDEVRSVYERATELGMRVLKLEGSTVTVKECLKQMESFSSVHLACHASQNAADPLQSQFLLHTGALNLATIIQSNLKNADLAFLSACQTSTGEEKLSDEAVHLAAGMLAAGYRRVVGTMWSIDDRRAREVAHDFYEDLWMKREQGCDRGFDGSLSAYALHRAIQQLRLRIDNSELSLLTWVPFVHFGY